MSKFKRPAEVPDLQGDSSKARKVLKWKPKIKFKELCTMMVENDLKKYNLTITQAREKAKSL